MPLKTTMEYYLTPNRMTPINKEGERGGRWQEERRKEGEGERWKGGKEKGKETK